VSDSRRVDLVAVPVQIYIDNANVRLEWDSLNRWIRIEYKRWFNTKETAEGIEIFLRAVREHHATCCLSDSRRRRVVQPDAQALLTESWVPKAAALGLQRLAIVLPESHLAQGTVESLLESYRDHLDVQCFTGLEAAQGWLRGEMGVSVDGPVSPARLS
jgi:hypothetical protein